MIIRGCKINDDTFISLLDNLRENDYSLKLLDLFGNKITDKGIIRFCDLAKNFSGIESLSLANNKIKRLKSFRGFMQHCGKFPISKAEYDQFSIQLKERDKIKEKNAKNRALKKPTLPVPHVDPIGIDSSSGEYFQTRYYNLKYFNIMGNPFKVDDESFKDLMNFIHKMPNTFFIFHFPNWTADQYKKLDKYNDRCYL